MALCLLVANGRLPRPEYIVIANTGRERSTTWDYLWQVMRPYLRAHGMRVHIASRRLAKVDLYGHNGDLLMPVYTATGKLSAFCSSEWKARVVQRWLRSRGVESATQWIGLALDETKRIKHQRPEPGPWSREYPLIDLLHTKADAERIITGYGLPLPHTSACWACPNLDNREWRDVRADPRDWPRAVALDEELDENDRATGGSGVYLHESRVRLKDANLDTANRREPNRQCSLFACQV